MTILRKAVYYWLLVSNSLNSSFVDNDKHTRN